MDLLLNWKKIGFFAVAAFIAAHFLMYRLRNKPRAHGIALYLATMFGGFSLLLGIYQSDEQLAKWSRPTFELQRRSALEMLSEQIEWERRYYCESPKAIRTQFSPVNFDEIVAAEAATCRSMQALASRSRDWTSSEEDISLPELGAPHFGMAMPEQSARGLLEIVGYHNEAAAELRRLDSVSAPSPLLVTLTVLGPYIFIASFMTGLASIAFAVGSPQLNFRRAITNLVRSLRRGKRD